MGGRALRIAIASDHRGVALKSHLIQQLRQRGMDLEDFGAVGPDAVDYPDYGMRVAEGVSLGKVDRGILICGTGIGMCIVANKYPGVRAALCHDLETARASRSHNDANVLVMAATTDPNLAAGMVETWLQTPFSGGRHARRLEKIRQLEQRLCERLHSPQGEPPEGGP